MTNLTETQSRLLNALRAIKAEGVGLIPQHDARAIGGLTDQETAEFLGSRCMGRYVSGRGDISMQIPGLSVNTYNALAKRGLIECRNGVWIARD